MRNTYSAVFLKQEGGYAAWVEEIPGVNTQGETLKEAKENLAEALELILDVNRELSRKQAPRGRKIHEQVRVKMPA